MISWSNYRIFLRKLSFPIQPENLGNIEGQACRYCLISDVCSDYFNYGHYGKLLVYLSILMIKCNDIVVVISRKPKFYFINPARVTTYQGGITMKKIMLGLMTGLLLISINVFASDVSVDSSGNVTTGVTNPAGSGNLDVTGASGEHAIRGVTSGTGAVGVYGENNDVSGYGGYFQGNARVTGDLTVDGTLTAPGLGDITLDNGNVGIGTQAPAARLDVSTTPVDTYGEWLPYDAYYEPCEHCMDTCNGNHWSEFSCPGGQTIACEDIRNDDGENWEYRVVFCNQIQQAGQFGGNVTVTNAVSAASFTGDGSGLTNVTASALSIDCPLNYILQKKASGWECQPLCQDGDMVGCYEGRSETLNVGACKAGSRICISSVYGSCAGQVLPGVDACNNQIDEDCNGVVDDGLQGAPGCIWFYRDADDDGYGDKNFRAVCMCTNPDPSSYADNDLDCYDADNRVHPSSNYYSASYGNPPSWDYDCDGQIEKEYVDLYQGCTGNMYGNCVGDGWDGTVVPACGVTASFRDCSGAWPGCSTSTLPVTQKCK